MTKLCSFVAVNVDEWMQEVDNLSVQDMPRSASSLSIRTDASGTGVSCFIHGLDSEVNSLVHSVLWAVNTYLPVKEISLCYGIMTMIAYC